MLKYKNSLIVSKECFKLLLDYSTMSDFNFLKCVKTICETHKMEFGLNSFYTDYLNKYKNVELEHKKEVFNKMGEFVDWLTKKDEGNGFQTSI